MTDEFEYIKQFIAEHPTPEYFIPEDYVILSKVADTPHYLREYFEWKGEQRAIEALHKIADLKNGKHCVIRLGEE